MHGGQQVLEYKLTSEGSYAAFDSGTGSLDWDGGDIQEELGAGAQAVAWAGMITPTGNVDTSLRDGVLLAHVKPATAGALPPKIAAIRAGVLSSVEGGQAIEHTDCYITGTTISLSEGGIVSVGYEWTALSADETTIVSAAAAPTKGPYPWHTASIKLGGRAYRVGEITITTECPVEGHSSLDEKTPGSARLPEWLTPGAFKASFSATLRIPLGSGDYDPLADCPGKLGLTLTVSSCAYPPDTLTVTLANMIIAAPPTPIVAGGELVEYSIEGTGLSHDLASWSAAVT